MADLDAVLLSATLDVLEAEFCRILTEHSAPLAMQDSSKPDPITSPRIPVAAQLAEPTMGVVVDLRLGSSKMVGIS